MQTNGFFYGLTPANDGLTPANEIQQFTPAAWAKSGCSGSLNQLASSRIRETQHVPHALHLNYRDFDWLIGLLRLRDVPNGAFA